MAQMSWKQAIRHVLSEHGGAMHYQDIADRIIELDLRDSYGATPRATVIAQLTASIKHKSRSSPFYKASKALYGLRSQLGSEDIASSTLGDEEDEVDDVAIDSIEDAGLVQAFGMYWRRDAVHWSSKATLLGRQQLGATEVDFAGQLGVYLLHDGREVVYVGRSTDRPMGLRLYEHTKDRLQTRWDRFSWFGLLKVTQEGGLIEAQIRFTPELVAVTLEAVLIEGLEPRQNRRRGDGFNATEYLQAEDPEIQRREQLRVMDSLRSKL